MLWNVHETWSRSTSSKIARCLCFFFEPNQTFQTLQDHDRRLCLSERNVLMYLIMCPTGEGPFPGIIDLYTLGGTVCEPRAALLANKGFVVFALAFYGYQDMPKTVDRLDLEYFEEGVTFLQTQPKVSRVKTFQSFKIKRQKYMYTLRLICHAGYEWISW